ncbi:MAG: choice-of-anchor C family protein [Pseudomonadota bacterium]
MKGVILGGALAMGMASAASAVTIANGSFEQPGTFSGTFTNIPAGGVLPGWTVGGAGVDLINTYWTAQDNNYSLDLSGTGAGTITQTITGMTVDQAYKVSFWMAGNPDRKSDPIKSLSAGIGMAGGGTFNFDVTNESRPNLSWEEMSFTFTAGETSGDLFFQSLEINAFGPALDNISISAVPLPAGGLLLLGGLLGFGALRRTSRG